MGTGEIVFRPGSNSYLKIKWMYKKSPTRVLRDEIYCKLGMWDEV